MAWSISGGYVTTHINQYDRTVTDVDFDAASMFKVALYDNGVTPAFSATGTGAQYNGSGSAFLATGGATGSTQVYTTEWPQGGRTLVNNDVTLDTGNVLKWDADDTATSAATATMSNIYGCIIYASGAANPWIVCAIYFGGTAYSVTNGSFTIQWHANGIMTIDYA